MELTGGSMANVSENSSLNMRVKYARGQNNYKGLINNFYPRRKSFDEIDIFGYVSLENRVSLEYRND